MREPVRTWTVAVACLAAALTLTGCGGGHDDRGGGGHAAPGGGGPATPGTPSPGAASPGAASPGVSPGGAGRLEGSWLGVTDGGPVSLTVQEGRAVLLAGSRLCQGTARGTDTVALSLTCDDGGTDRAKGSAVSGDGRQAVVTWASGTRDTLRRSPLNLAPAVPASPPVPSPMP
ncbi:hypothetical protein ACLGI4_12550 [Streptomyces sp. HMX112]|uniref:hypothetical protein n=1 Tax=Streptomyces sp. HMX112 TaxID=3390850 RepID=UPI003A7FA6A2